MILWDAKSVRLQTVVTSRTVAAKVGCDSVCFHTTAPDLAARYSSALAAWSLL